MLLLVGYKNYEDEQERKAEKLANKNIVEVEETFDERFAKLKERNEKEYVRRLKEENNSFYVDKPVWVVSGKEDLAEIGEYVEIQKHNPYSHKLEKMGVCIKNIVHVSETNEYFNYLIEIEGLSDNEQWVVLDLEIDFREFSRYKSGFECDFRTIQVKYSDDFLYFSKVYLLENDIVMPEEDFGVCKVALKIRTDKDIKYLKIGSIYDNVGYIKFV